MNTVSVTQKVLNIPEGKQIAIVDEKRYKQPNYYRVGNGTMNRDGIQSINLITEVMDMTKAEQFLIKSIQEGYTYDPDVGAYSFTTYLQPKLMSSTEQQYLLKGFKLLHAKDLVRRVSRGVYMINPNALIPNRYDDALLVWNKAKAHQSATN